MSNVQRDRMCRDKRRHASLEVALEELHRMTGFNLYLCPYCHYWHIGHHRKPGQFLPDGMEMKISTHPHEDKV